ncbi:MAG: hypothetical protein ABI456_18170 [Ktedonobacteraceae bacterium]|nr:hypothetical protein [Chloroflexota bacterium]
MTDGVIEVHPTQMHGASPVAKNASTDTSNLSQTVDTSIADLANALVAVDILSGVAGSIEHFSQGLLSTLACFATGLTVIGTGLEIAAQAFETLDSALAATFKQIESQLSYYTGFETHATMPAAHVPPSGGYTLSVTHLSLHITQHTSLWGSFTHSLSSAWDATGGQVVHFVAQHGQAFAIGAGVVVIVGVGILLTPVTLGGSDAGAGVAAAALLAAA